MLCRRCDTVRHKQFLESRANLSNDTVKAANIPTESRRGKTVSARSVLDSTSTLRSTAGFNSDNGTDATENVKPTISLSNTQPIEFSELLSYACFFFEIGVLLIH